MANLNVAGVAQAAVVALFQLNSLYGTGRIKALTVNVAESSLDGIKGSVEQTDGKVRKFGLKAKNNGKVEVRYLDKKKTVAAE
jgi:hypothetical protein